MRDVPTPVSSEATRHDVEAPEHVPGDDEPRVASGGKIGRYVLLSSLGRGGMSVVYLAYDPELDRKVALKLMRATMLGERGKLRLQREAQALARLSHPNVVPVYDAGTVEDQAFVAMEFVEGKTLRRWLREARPWRERLAVMIDAGRGLAAAHAAGLIHRDFKPDNVLLGEDGRVRVADFGLARLASVLDGSIPPSSPSLEEPPSESGVPLVPSSTPALVELTRADQLVGTPAYMAPEQMRREATDERADQYAFCVTLYEALYGARPFDVASLPVGSAASTADLGALKSVPRAPRPPPRGSPVPKWLHRVLVRGMSEDPAARWPHMDDVLAALTADPGRKWRRGAAVIAAAAVVVLGAGVVARAQARTRALCEGGAARAAATWGDAQRAELAGAFAKTGLPYADTATRTMTRALDAYARDWAAMNDESCAATRLRGEQSEEVLDLRTACLSDRMKELTALVDVARHADAETVQQASRAADVLVPIASCADIAALRAPAPRPRDAATAAKVDELERRLAMVEANYAVGKPSDAAKLGDALLPEATALAYGPLVAQVNMWRGRAFADLDDSEHSIPAFRDAFASALAARADGVLRVSAARLAQEYVYASDLPAFEAWAEIGEAAIARSGPDPDTESFLSHVRCVAMWQRGGLKSRLECLQKHAAKVERARPLNDWELVTLGLAATEAGDFTRGVEALRKSYEYSLERNGRDHPRTLEMHEALCKGTIDYGDFDSAVVVCQEVRRDAERVAADNPTLIAKAHMYYGTLLSFLHRYDEALEELLRGKGQVQDLDELLLEIANVEARLGRPDDALVYQKRSLDAAEKLLPPEHSNRISSQLGMGTALLERGDLNGAREQLDRAMEVSVRAELAPIVRADLEFAEARALWRSDPGSRERAVELARQARAVYAESAPPTKRYQEEAAKIAAWLGDAAVRGEAYAPGGLGREPW